MYSNAIEEVLSISGEFGYAIAPETVPLEADPEDFEFADTVDNELYPVVVTHEVIVLMTPVTADVDPKELLSAFESNLSRILSEEIDNPSAPEYESGLCRIVKGKKGYYVAVSSALACDFVYDAVRETVLAVVPEGSPLVRIMKIHPATMTTGDDEPTPRRTEEEVL